MLKEPLKAWKKTWISFGSWFIWFKSQAEIVLLPMTLFLLLSMQMDAKYSKLSNNSLKSDGWLWVLPSVILFTQSLSVNISLSRHHLPLSLHLNHTLIRNMHISILVHIHTLYSAVPPACVISQADVWSLAPCKWIPFRPGRRTWPHKNPLENRFQTSSYGPGGKKRFILVFNQYDIGNIFFPIMLIAFYGVFIVKSTLKSFV